MASRGRGNGAQVTDSPKEAEIHFLRKRMKKIPLNISIRVFITANEILQLSKCLKSLKIWSANWPQIPSLSHISHHSSLLPKLLLLQATTI